LRDKLKQAQDSVKEPLAKSYVIEFEGKCVHYANLTGLGRKQKYQAIMKTVQAAVSAPDIERLVHPLLLEMATKFSA
jgi:hypothetical protein